MTSSFKMLALVIATFVLALALASPLLTFFQEKHQSLGVDVRLFAAPFVGISNAFDILLALLFVFLSCMLLIHRVVWPLLIRTPFRMQDIGTRGRRGILMTVGLALLGWSGAKIPDLMKELMKAVGKG
jgi:hypothetical protein